MSEKRRIGIFLNCTPDWGGQYQYCLMAMEALSSLSKNKYEVVAIYSYDCWVDICSSYGFESHKIFPRSVSIYNDIHNLKCDLLLYLAEGFNISELVPDIPVVVAVHDLNFHYDRENTWVQSEIGYSTYEGIYGKLTNRAVGILVDSEYGKRQLMDLYGKHCEKKITVLPFVPPRYLNEKDSVDKIYTSSLELPDKYIFYPAVFFPHKNHKNLILAAKKLKDRDIIVKLVFTGQENEYRKKIKKFVDQNDMTNQVVFIGRISDNDMLYAYRNARAMVMPTLEGPTNIPPLEAMLLGCPVAVSRIGAMPEQVGKDGLTFDPKDVDEISTILERLWLDDTLCERQIYNGFVQMKKNTIEVFNKRFAIAINNAIERVDSENKVCKDMLQEVSSYKIICYGLGENGYWLHKYLLSQRIPIEAFFDQNPDNNTFFNGAVCRIEDWKQRKEDYVVLLTLNNEKTNKMIEEKLMSHGFRHTYIITKEIVLSILQHFDCYVHYPRG